MEERRKSKRVELESRIVMKSLDGKNKEVIIDIVDVSKSGVGFTCSEPLMIGTIYESFLTIWTKEVLHAFLEIVRIEKASGYYNYGASFVGMPELDASRIGIYTTINEQDK